MKKIIGIAAAALMSLSLFACGTTTTKMSRTIDDIPYSTTKVIRRADTRTYKAPRVLSPRTARINRTVDAPNILPYALDDGNMIRNAAPNRSAHNATTPYNVNN